VRKQKGVSILTLFFLIGILVAVVIGVGSYLKQEGAEEAKAAALKDAQRKQQEAAELAAKAEAEKRKAQEMEHNKLNDAIELCHAYVIKRAKYESKARITKTEIKRETEKTNAGEREMYVVTGKVDFMNAFGAFLPNNYLCRVDLSGESFIRDPSVAGEDEGDDPEKAELAKAYRTLGLNPDDHH
jgi:hypothetical protein